MTCFKVLKFSKILFNCAGFKTICQIHPEIVNCFDPSKDTVFWWKNNYSGKKQNKTKKSFRQALFSSFVRARKNRFSCPYFRVVWDLSCPHNWVSSELRDRDTLPLHSAPSEKVRDKTLLHNHTLHQWSSLHSGLNSRSPHLSERLTENSWLAFLATNHYGIYSPCRELWNQSLDWQAPQLKTHYREIFGLNLSSSF